MRDKISSKLLLVITCLSLIPLLFVYSGCGGGGGSQIIPVVTTVEPPVATTTASISGQLTDTGFVSTSPNLANTAIQAPMHAPIVGVDVIIVGTNWQATTDVNGFFLISGVDPGSWNLYAQTSINNQTVAFYQENISVVAGQTINIGSTIMKSAATVGGTIDSLTLPLESAEIQLIGQSTVSDVAGSFSFSGVPFGDWPILIQKTGYTSYIGTVSVSLATVNVTYTLSPLASPTGSINVISNPNGAHILIDSVDSGIITDGIVSGIPTGTHTVEVYLSGYDVSPPFEVITVTAGNTTLTGNFLLTPDPGKGSVLVLSDAPGADIYLDGVNTGLTTPVELKNVNAGFHAVSVLKSGFNITPAAQAVTVVANASVTINFTVTPVPLLTTGIIEVTGTYILPLLPQPKTYLDGFDSGTGLPMVLTGVTPGNHTIGLESPWILFDTFQKNVMVTAGATTSVNFNSINELTNLGTLRVIANPVVIPSDAKFLLNDQWTGINILNQQIALPAGSQEIAVYRPGFVISSIDSTLFTRDAYLLPGGQTIEVDVAADGSDMGQISFFFTNDTGTLNVTSTPAGAKIFIDGTDSGRVTPWTNTQMIAGTYLVETKINGYVSTPVSTLLSVTTGNTSSAHFQLTNVGTIDGTLEIDLADQTLCALWQNTFYPVSGVNLAMSGVTGTTGANGCGVLSGIEVGDHTMTATKAGFTPHSEIITLFSGGSSHTFEIALNPPAVLSGFIVNTQGVPVPNAVVTMLNPDLTPTIFTNTQTNVLTGYMLTGVPVETIQVAVTSLDPAYQNATTSVVIDSTNKVVNLILGTKSLPAPTNFFARLTYDQIADTFSADFSWDAMTASTLLGYKLFYSTTDPVTGFMQDGGIITGTTTSFSQNLSNGTDYWFRIASVNIDGIPLTAAEGPGVWSDPAQYIKIDDIEVADIPLRLVTSTLGNPFTMGSVSGDAEAESDELPAPEVHISQSFYMSPTEMSQGTWEIHMGYNPGQGYGTGANYPVYNVSMDEVEEFIRRLNNDSAVTGLGFFRLPTEAEWEWACRQGTTGVSIYPWGDLLSDGAPWCWSWQTAGGAANPVDSLQAAANGFYHMNGNVWEWCSDWYSSQTYGQSSIVYDPKGPLTGSKKVVRGGSWHFVERSCRTSDRSSRDPAQKHFNVGFRLVFVPAPRLN